MRERLVELIKHDNCISPMSCSSYCKYSDLDDCHSARLADLIIADGWIRPPCKVGDKVWFVERRFHYNLKTFKEFVCEGYVKAIKVSMKPMKITIEYPIADDPKGRCKGADWSAESIGKTVFLTKEEAEEALKRKECEGK